MGICLWPFSKTGCGIKSWLLSYYVSALGDISETLHNNYEFKTITKYRI